MRGFNYIVAWCVPVPVDSALQDGYTNMPSDRLKSWSELKLVRQTPQAARPIAGANAAGVETSIRIVDERTDRSLGLLIKTATRHANNVTSCRFRLVCFQIPLPEQVVRPFEQPRGAFPILIVSVRNIIERSAGLLEMMASHYTWKHR